MVPSQALGFLAEKAARLVLSLNKTEQTTVFTISICTVAKKLSVLDGPERYSVCLAGFMQYRLWMASGWLVSLKKLFSYLYVKIEGINP